MAEFELDPVLLDAIRAKKAVLFLGAGASRGASKKNGACIPDAAGLAKVLCDEFLGPDYAAADFKTIYDLSCSVSSIRDVQNAVHRELEGYQPADFHLLVPEFAWAGIVTTNYDLIMERAYENSEHSVQELLPNCKDGDGVPESLGPNGLLYVKLHGCITHYQEIDPPLIASTEQIIRSKLGRAGQFAQFLEWARTKTLIFVGYGLGDFNLRTLVDEIIREGDGARRHFIVRPGIQKAESDYWQDRRMRTINVGFEEFLRSLSSKISPQVRKLSLALAAPSVTSFTRFISKSGVSESDSLVRYLSTQCEHVTVASAIEDREPARFYKGFDLGWYPFKQELDVPRRVTRDIFDERIVAQGGQVTQLILVKSHAGSGKSVVLRRLAWDAATKLDRLVFRVQGGSALDIDVFEEIVSLTNKTIYLFIDDITDDVDQTRRFYAYALKRKWPMVVLGAARIHEWNVRCEDISTMVDEEYELQYLSDHEIGILLGKLKNADALGHLATLNFEDQKKKLKELYGRQLLVALHEATENASFRDIIADEFQSLFPPEAKLLYLDICSLHRFGPPVRAGLISRVHGIDFDEFNERFFKPLEQVIDLTRDSKTQDWVYRARHAVIAEIVYNVALTSTAEKFDNLMRIIGKLNPSYSYDQEVLFQLVRAGTIAELFPDRVMGEAIYKAAVESFGELKMLIHQQGIYEMRRAGDVGGLDRAERLLEKALGEEGSSSAIKHSLAELALKRASIATGEADREVWRRRSESQAKGLAQKGVNSYPHHTLAKIAISRVRDAVEANEKGDNELTAEVLGVAIKEAEDVIRDGLKRFPNDDRLLNEEATLGEILENADRSLAALKKAAKSNPRSELIARRLSRIQRAKGLGEDAIQTIRSTLELNPGSQTLHYELALSLMERFPNADIVEGEAILYHLSRSFTNGDKNNQARFWYARQLCLGGQWRDGVRIFSQLRTTRVPFSQRRKIRGIVKEASGAEARYSGQLYAKKGSFGFVRADQDGMEMFISSDQLAPWESVGTGQRITYSLGFNLDGPTAINGIT